MKILKVAIPVPISQLFDYLPLQESDKLQPGMRLSVPFGRRQLCVGLLMEVTEHSDLEPSKLKKIVSNLDPKQPLLPAPSLQLLRWASRYYHYPIGEVVSTALPNLLNQGEPAQVRFIPGWKLSEAGQQLAVDSLPGNAVRQREILSLLQNYPQGLSQGNLSHSIANVTATLRTLEKKGWLLPQSISPQLVTLSQFTVDSELFDFQLNSYQQQAVQQVQSHLTEFYPCLLDGVTGSGKTEVYLQLIQRVLEQGRQALILVPEINLTPQMLQRFQQRFRVPIAIFHSKLTEQERLHTWLLAREGEAPIVIGTRSAIWTPLKNPGLFIVDEEHDTSYKQQDHFRYSARDVAVVRAQQAGVPILLGSATPSLESLYNAQQQRYRYLSLPERAGRAVHPRYRVVDMRKLPQSSLGLSPQLKKAIQARLDQEQQVLLFINRRGYAPILTCYECGWVANCGQCDARLTYHAASKTLLCHHCGAVQLLASVCPQCQHPKVHLVGLGTERIEERLQSHFSKVKILRIDSDSTRAKQAMQNILEHIHSGESAILVGTQMLAKGHHFPKVTLVGIINLDGGLYGIDFRSTERMAQLLIQVAGRAGRADEPGEVIVQTHHPDHPLLTLLIQQGYGAFSQAALQERQQAELPPYSHLALMRAEAASLQVAQDFLSAAKDLGKDLGPGEVNFWGPVPAPMEKRANWYRAQLLLQAGQRDSLYRFLTAWLPKLSSATAQLRWSLDVDPQDLY